LKTKLFQLLEVPGIEPGAFHMQSERATTALYPLFITHKCTKQYLKVKLNTFANFEVPAKIAHRNFFFAISGVVNRHFFNNLLSYDHTWAENGRKSEHYNL
jgi:hypothetical protein